jgi:hypothetical protein
MFVKDRNEEGQDSLAQSKSKLKRKKLMLPFEE